jgi:hypothetical protein
MPLHQRDQLKLIRAGFTIIRADYQNLLIKHKTYGVLHWKTLKSGFASKAALDREMNQLLTISTIIND